MKSMLAPVVLALTTVACGSGDLKTYDTAAMQTSAKAVGTESALLASSDETESEDAIQSKVLVLGSSMQALSTQHYGLSVSGGSSADAPEVDSALGLLAESDEYSYDGTKLVLKFGVESTGNYYDVNLTFGSSDDGGSTIDGTYIVQVDTEGSGVGVSYDLDVVYNTVLFDTNGCAYGGSIDISYSFGVTGLEGIPGAGLASQSGRVISTFNACDDVTVTGT